MITLAVADFVTHAVAYAVTHAAALATTTAGSAPDLAATADAAGPVAQLTHDAAGHLTTVLPGASAPEGVARYSLVHDAGHQLPDLARGGALRRGPGWARVEFPDRLPGQAPAPPGAGNVPNPDATPPPGSEKLLTLLGYIKWIALAAISAAFFGGVATFTGGRIFDNRRAGSIGSIMILVSLAGALAFGIAPLLLNSFSSG